MAAKGIFTGLSLAQVQAIQAKAISFLTEGKTLMSYSVDGISRSKQFAMPIADVLEECAYAINHLTTGAGPRRRTYSSFNPGGLRSGELAID